LRLEPKNADGFYNRGFAKFAKEEYDAALADFDAVVRLRPRDVDALLARAAVRVEQNLPNLAIADLDAALGIDPEDVGAYCERGKIREEAGEYRLALYDYQLALQRASDDPLVLNYLAWLLSTAPEASLRDGRRAVEMAARAVKLENSQEWDTIDTLAAAFAEVGKFPEAVRAEEEALRLAPAEEHGDLKLRLELYRAKKAYRLGGR
jgi:tetratricopeptide (TPR) repeat protein